MIVKRSGDVGDSHQCCALYKYKRRRRRRHPIISQVKSIIFTVMAYTKEKCQQDLFFLIGAQHKISLAVFFCFVFVWFGFLAVAPAKKQKTKKKIRSSNTLDDRMRSTD